MSMIALDIFKELASYYPAFIPCIIIAYTGSVSALHCWKGVHCVPQRNKFAENEAEDDAITNAPCPKVMQVVTTTILIGFFVAIYVVPEFLDDASHTTALRIFYLCMLFVPSTGAVITMTLSFSGTFERMLVRKSDGKAAISFRKAKNHRRILIIVVWISGFLIAYAALWEEQPLAILIVYLSLLQSFTSSLFNGKLKLRATFWYNFVVSLLSISLAIVIVITGGQRRNNNGVLKSGSEVIQWRTIFNSLLCLMIPFTDLPILLRFDHANALPADFEPPVRMNTIGFQITYRLEAFPRPYYMTAFIVFLCSFVAVAAASVNGYIICTFENVSFYVTLVSTPFIIFAVMTLAAMKGQLKKLWFYEEDWGVIPKVDTEAGDSASKDFDELQSEPEFDVVVAKEDIEEKNDSKEFV